MNTYVGSRTPSVAPGAYALPAFTVHVDESGRVAVSGPSGQQFTVYGPRRRDLLREVEVAYPREHQQC